MGRVAGMSAFDRMRVYLERSAIHRVSDPLAWQARYLHGLAIQARLRAPKTISNIRHIRRVAR